MYFIAGKIGTAEFSLGQIVIAAIIQTAGVAGVATAEIQSIFQIRNRLALGRAKGLAGIIARLARFGVKIPFSSFLGAITVELAGAVAFFFNAGLLIRAVSIVA